MKRTPSLAELGISIKIIDHRIVPDGHVEYDVSVKSTDKEIVLSYRYSDILDQLHKPISPHYPDLKFPPKYSMEAGFKGKDRQFILRRQNELQNYFNQLTEKPRILKKIIFYKFFKIDTVLSAELDLDSSSSYPSFDELSISIIDNSDSMEITSIEQKKITTITELLALQNDSEYKAVYSIDLIPKSALTYQSSTKLIEVLKGSLILNELILKDVSCGVVTIVENLVKAIPFCPINKLVISGMPAFRECVDLLGLLLTPNMRCLEISGCSIQDFCPFFQFWLNKKDVQINSLNISRNNLSEKAIKFLADIMYKNKYMQSLSIAHSNITVSSVSSLCRVLQEDNYTLTSLNLSGLTFPAKTSDPAIMAISAMMMYNKAITQLILDDMEVEVKASSQMKYECFFEGLSTAIYMNTELKDLSLKNNFIPHSGRFFEYCLKPSNTIELDNSTGVSPSVMSYIKDSKNRNSANKKYIIKEYQEDHFQALLGLMIQSYISNPRFTYVKPVEKRTTLLEKIMTTILNYSVTKKWHIQCLFHVLENGQIPVGFSITIPPGGDLFIPKSILIKESAGIVMSIGAKFASTFQSVSSNLDTILSKVPIDRYRVVYYGLLPCFDNDTSMWNLLFDPIYKKSVEDNVNFWTFSTDPVKKDLFRQIGLEIEYEDYLSNPDIGYWSLLKMRDDL